MKLLDTPFGPSRDGAPPRITWIGALSFEARCLGSVVSLLKENTNISRAIAFDYPTTISPKSSGEQARALHRSELERLLGTALDFRIIHPYRYSEFIGELYRLSNDLAQNPVGEETPRLVIDITCLTKVHTLAVAYWSLTRPEQYPVTLAYSQPEYYGNPSRNIWGRGKWSTTSLLRLDPDSTDPYASTTAVAILGHEGDRLRLALHEAEADEVVIIKASPSDPNSRLISVSDVQNAWLFREMEKGNKKDLKKEEVGIRDFSRMEAILTSLCEAARKKKARVVLCPFGPKTFVFLSGYICLSRYRENTWLSYPQPVSYDPEYSEGYKYTLWCEP